MGLAPVAWTLFSRHLRHSPQEPDWPDRDRFVLSAGHASALLYALLHLTGYDLPLDELKRFRQLGSADARAPGARRHAGGGDHHGPAGAGLRQLGRLRPGRGHAGRALQPAGARGGVPSHLVHLLGRRPDGGHLPRGRLDRRLPAPRAADRDLRRQPHQPGRAHQPGVRRGRARPLRRLRVAGPARGRRQRPRGDRARPLGGGGRRRPAHADRLPHPHRVRRAPQAGHLVGPRVPARPRGDRGHQARLRLARVAHLPGARRGGGLAGGAGRAGPRARGGLARAVCRLCRRVPRRGRGVRARDAWAGCTRAGSGWRRASPRASRWRRGRRAGRP